ncbi:MAG: glycosyltransferase family 9 protein [Verrucomicrobiota bacterium]|nr:glycosyltransferase family 9 protein [Verrucomicrobiota bacterium]
MTRLLIIKPSSLGDIVHGLQVATSLKAQRPDLRVSWVVRDIFAPLVRACDTVEHTYVFRREGGLKGFLELTREIRETKFDYAFDFQGLLRTGLMMWRARADKKVGRSDAREAAWIFYKQLVMPPPGGWHCHAIDILLQFCPFLAASPELRGSLRFRAPENLNLNFVFGPGGAAPIVMFPDSRRPEKRWGGFKELTELIIRDGTGRKVIWAGNNYFPDKDAFPSAQFLNLTGNTSLVSLPALIQRADWVISNDSGPMHLAAALGVRTLGIFGPTDPRRFGPYPLNAPTNHVIQAPVGALKLLQTKEVFTRFQRLDSARPKIVRRVPFV